MLVRAISCAIRQSSVAVVLWDVNRVGGHPGAGGGGMAAAAWQDDWVGMPDRCYLARRRQAGRVGQVYGIIVTNGGESLPSFESIESIGRRRSVDPITSNLLPPHTYPSAAVIVQRLIERYLAFSCEGKSTCMVRADDKTFYDNCPDTSKYLEIVYECARKGSSR